MTALFLVLSSEVAEEVVSSHPSLTRRVMICQNETVIVAFGFNIPQQKFSLLF